MTAQVSVAVAHDFWISRGGHRNTSGGCESFGPIAVIGRGRLVGRTVFVPFEGRTPSGKRAGGIEPPTGEVRPGTMLVREWNGRMHRVAVLVDGFA
jgi:hypothetical protein